MKLLPPAPERKLLKDGRYVVGCDVAADDFSVFVTVREEWCDGKFTRYIEDTIVEQYPNPYWHGKAPFVEFK